MDKKQLKKITTKIYEEYGFVKKGKYYYLDLEDVLVCSGFDSVYGVTYLAYNFSIKAIHSNEEYKPNHMFDGYDSTQNEIYFDKTAKGYHMSEICFEDWTEDYYTDKLRNLLHYYFDPYKNNALAHIKRAGEEMGYVHKDELILVTEKAKKYIETHLST